MENRHNWPDAWRFAGLGLLINSALYLGAIIAAGLVTGDAFAWKLALLSVGACYIGYFLQIGPSRVPRRIIAAIVYLSIALGVLAGLALLF